MFIAPVRATPGLKMMRLLNASNARRSSPLHAERWAPFSIAFNLYYIYINISSMAMSSPGLFCSTTVETVETSTATVVPVMSWPYPPTLDPCGCAICATPFCCREAPPQLPDKEHLRELSNTTHTLLFLTTMLLLMLSHQILRKCEFGVPFPLLPEIQEHSFIGI